MTRSDRTPAFVVARAQRCHSLVRPAGDHVEPAWTALAADLPERSSLWPHRHGTTRDRERERRRPLDDRSALRVVDLGQGEIVLVARRDTLALCCLRVLAAALAAAPTDRDNHTAAWRDHRHAPHADPHPTRLVAPGLPGADPGATAGMVERVRPLPGVTCDVVALRAAAARVLATFDPADATFTGTAIAVTSSDEAPDAYLPMLAGSAAITIALHAAYSALTARCWIDPRRIGLTVADGLLDQVWQAMAADGSLPVIADEAARAVLDAGTGTALAPGRDIFLHEAFDQVVSRQPDAVAVVAGGGRFTYRELADRSMAAARGLRDQAVGRGDRVAICMERGPDLVVALLAVLRAGACYVPLDPSHPAMRRAYAIEDAGAKVLITDGAPSGTMTPESTVDELVAAGSGIGMPEAGLPSGDQTEPAYVIYTSGTTGQPKGVVVSHGNVLALIAATRDSLDLSSTDVWTMFHSAAFDFSVWEMWGCLLTGGRLVLVPHWAARSPQEMADLLTAHGVTVLNQTPSAFQALMPELLARDTRAPRLIIFGGEPLPVRMLGPWIRRHPVAGCRLVNMFGITETTVHVTLADIGPREILSGSRTVGRSLPGWSVSVRDAQGRPVPFGAVGEIYVGGAGVAHGYLGREGLTRERFVADAWTGQRLYRSGDVGRLHPDGSLEHLGRADDQVKLRGYRIELGEIQSAFREDPAVKDAAVIIRHRSAEADAAEAVIDAYVVPAGDGLLTADLRRRLNQRLPDYMMPAAIIAVTGIPLTANGKTDADALRSLAASRPAEEAGRREASPSGDVASLVLDVWRELFDADVDPAQTFFELGGNSLLALRMSVALTERGLRSVSPRELYLNPTVAQLSALLSAREVAPGSAA